MSKNSYPVISMDFVLHFYSPDKFDFCTGTAITVMYMDTQINSARIMIHHKGAQKPCATQTKAD